MVNAVDPFGSKNRFQTLVQRFCILERLAKRLFQNHLAVRRIADARKAFRDHAEKARRDCEVRDKFINSARAEIIVQPGISGRIGKVHAVVVDPRRKARKRAVRVGEACKLAHPVPGKFAVLLSGIIAPADHDDFVIQRLCAGYAAVIQRGQQLAEGQVARAAEYGKCFAHPFLLHS